LRTSVEDIGFAVKRRDQPVDTFVFQDSAEFGVAGRYLADCAVKVDIRDQPRIAVAPHHVIDINRLTISFDDLALDHDPSSGWLFSGDLQILPGVAVETIGIDGCDVTPEAFDDLLPLRQVPAVRNARFARASGRFSSCRAARHRDPAPYRRHSPGRRAPERQALRCRGRWRERPLSKLRFSG
jgi:hypothetical protein